MTIRKPDLRPAPAREQAGGGRAGEPADRAAIDRVGIDHAPIDHGALRHSLGYRIHLADLANMQGFARAFAGTGLTAARYTALELIGSNPGIKPADLAAAMAVERSNLVALVRFLAERGWVETGAGPNRREKSLALTTAGREALVGLRERLVSHDRDLSARLSAEDRAALERLLARIVGA